MSYVAATDSSVGADSGGSSTIAIAAGTVANTVVKAAPGRLCRVLLTTAAATAAIQIFDNATTNSGTVIGYIPLNATVGSIFDFQFPAANGITVGGAASNAAMTVSYL